jgi:hypothetical protein
MNDHETVGRYMVLLFIAWKIQILVSYLEGKTKKSEMKKLQSTGWTSAVSSESCFCACCVRCPRAPKSETKRAKRDFFEERKEVKLSTIKEEEGRPG